MTSLFWNDPGRKSLWMTLTVIYCTLVLGAIFIATWYDLKLEKFSPVGRIVIVGTGLALSLAPTLYWWKTSWDFDSWIVGTKLEVDQEKFERERFKTNRDHALAVWAIVLAVYAAFLIKS